MLVNGGSASASEIVAGALKNLDRAVIIGTRTFGKGSVQELYDNEDHSKLKLTIAQYLTPGDRSIQNLGIVPDIQLQRMYIPDKNDAPTDFVRMLAADADVRREGPRLAPRVDVRQGQRQAGVRGPVPRRAQEDAGRRRRSRRPRRPMTTTMPNDDEIVEDFEMRFAKDVVAGVNARRAPSCVAGGEQGRRAASAPRRRRSSSPRSATIGVDWTAPAATAGEHANLEVSLDDDAGGEPSRPATIVTSPRP